MNKRISKQEYFMKLASISAERSTCPRASVWVVVVKDDVVIATWYNWACRWEDSCLDDWCLLEHWHCVRSVHAEMNSIINAARVWVPLKWAELYCTHKPCSICSRIIINSWIKKVYYKKNYRTQNFNIWNYIEVEKLI